MRRRRPADPYAALDLAPDKLEARLRKQHDKRYTRRGNGRIPAAEVADARPGRRLHSTETDSPGSAEEPGGRDARPPGSVRSRYRARARRSSARRPTSAAPMTLDQALYEMELVGHDFYLFVDSETKSPASSTGATATTTA